MKAPFKRRTAAAVAVLFFVQNVCLLHAIESSFWSERKAKQRTAPVQLAQVFSAPNLTPPLGLDPLKSVNIQTSLQVPSSLSEITAVAAPYAAVRESHMSKNPQAPLIIHIQDIHGHEEAQKNIASVVAELAKKRGIKLVGLEGAEGPFNLEPYRSYPNKKATAFLADAFLKQGYLSGPEATALTADHPPVLWGVERLDLYRKNVEVVVQGKSLEQSKERFFNEAAGFLTKYKRAIYSPALLALDRRLEAYERGDITLGSYVESLLSAWAKLNGSEADFPQLALFTQAVAEEKKIPFERAQEERNHLVAALMQKLSTAALENVVQRSIAARAGQEGIADFYRFLQNLCRDNEISLSHFPHFESYVHYLFHCEEIRRIDLLNQVAELEEKVFRNAVRSEPERILAGLSKDVSLISKLSRHQITPDEWDFLSDRGNDVHAWSERARRLMRLQNSLDTVPVLDPAVFQADESFCAIALARNQALVDNLLSRMKTAKENRALLVAGGFHTEGLTALLRKKDVSYVVLTPKITKVSGNESDYLDVFYRDPTPIEKAFVGQQIYLATERLLSVSPSPLTSTASRARVLEGLFAAVEPAFDAASSAAEWDAVRPVLEQLADRFVSIDALSVTRNKTSSFCQADISARVEEKNGAKATVRVLVTTPDEADLVKNRNRHLKLLTALESNDTVVLVFQDSKSALFIGWLNPLWENVLVAGLVILTRYFLGQSLFSTSEFSLINLSAVGIIATLITLGHAIVKRDRRLTSLLQWFAAFSVFTGGFMFLSWPLASQMNLSIHVGWNQAYLYAWRHGWRLAKIMVSLSMMPEAVESDIDQKLDKALSKLPGKTLLQSPALVFNDSADAVEAVLRAKIGQRSLMRVTLRNRSDLLALTKRAHIGEKSVVDRDENTKFNAILEQGGIILIDYNKSNPRIVLEFNSLYDDPSYYGSRLAHPEVKIIGVLDYETERRKKPEEQYAVDFYRRFKIKVEIGAIPPDALVEQRIKKVDDLAGAIEIELNQNPDFETKLLGNTSVDDRIRIVPGKLVEAIKAYDNAMKNGETPKPLLIRGGLWGDTALSHFFRQAILNGHFDFNGRPVNLPTGLVIRRADTDYSKNVVAKKIIAASEAKLSGDVWVINRETAGVLFSRSEVLQDDPTKAAGDRNGILVEAGGLLTQPSLRLRITDNELPLWVWHEIMHAPHTVEIEIGPGVSVPNVYRDFQTPASRKSVSNKPKTWGEAKTGNVVVIESDDPAYVHAKVKEEFGDEPFVHHVTPDTRLDQLLESLELETKPDDSFGFSSDRQPLLEALESGRTVIVDGLEANETLARQLETAFGPDPYLLVNNRRIPVNRLIITCRESTPLLSEAVNRTKLEPTDDDLLRIVLQDPENHFSEEELKGVMKLREIIAALPRAEVRHHELMEAEKSNTTWLRPFPNLTADQRRRLYPDNPSLGLSRLRLLCKYDSLLEGFEDVCISPYRDDPEVATYLRTVARLTFRKEEEGRKPNTIAGRKLIRVLNQTMDPAELQSNYFWRLADTLSLDQLPKDLHTSANLSTHNFDVVDVIARALIAHPDEPEKSGMYSDALGLRRDVRNVPQIDYTTRIGELSPADMQKKVIRLLDKGIPLMFMGSPGTGKSYMANAIREEAKYAGSQPPITVGSDTKEEDLWKRHQKNKEGRTEWAAGPVARWAAAKGSQLLVVDEANLTNPDLWNFMVDKSGPVIFTGNQRTMAGRNDSHFIQDHMVTLWFEEFDDDFLKNQVANNYLSIHKQDREALVKLILQLHELFKNVVQGSSLSLRDVQELVARVNKLTPNDWTYEQVVGIAWRQYRGLFNLNDRAALQIAMNRLFGVNVKTLEDNETKNIPQAKVDTFWNSDQIVLTPSTFKLVASIQDCLLVREARIKEEKNNVPTLDRLPDGKRGMVIEGSSGRGKDKPLIAELKSRGFVDAKSAPSGTPKTSLYYHINASPTADQDLMLQTIQTAQDDGSVVIISEMNSLPTNFLEGKLNDKLTQKPKIEGFFLFATMNSPEYGGRARLSTALLNRVIYCQEFDYSEDELITIGETIVARKDYSVSERDLLYLVKAHEWIRREIKNPAFQPTTPDFIEALEACQTMKSMEKAIEEVYGLVYLKRFLKGATLPSRGELRKFEPPKPVNNLQMIPRIYAGLMPPGTPPLTLHVDVVDDNAGYEMGGSGISLSPEAWAGDNWEGTFFHETSHGMFTRYIDGLEPGPSEDLKQLYDDLEDVRHLKAFDHFYPKARMSQPGAELRFAKMILTNNPREFADEFSQWSQQPKDNLTPRKMFQYTLLAYAKGYLGEESVARRRIEARAEAFDVINLQHNPFRAALPHLEAAKKYGACIPGTRAESAIFNAQHQALTHLKTMKEDFEALPKDFPKKKKKIEVTEQAKKATEVANMIQKRDIVPPAIKDEVPEPIPVTEASAPTDDDILKMKNALAGKRLHLPQFGMDGRNRMWAMLRTALAVALLFGAAVSIFLWFYSSGTPQPLSESTQPKPGPASPGLPDFGFHFSWPSWTSFIVALIFTFVVWKLRHTPLLQRIDNWIVPWLDKRAPRWLKNTLLQRMGGAHSEQEPDDANPIPLFEPEQEPEIVPLQTNISAEAGRWDERMQALSTTHRRELDDVLQEFIREELQPDKDYGPPPGDIDVLYFLYVDAVNYCRRLLGVPLRVRKEIIVTGVVDQNNLILREFFRYFSTSGFSVRLAQQSLTNEEKAKLSKGKAVAFIDADELLRLQRKVQLTYLYGAERAALEERREELERAKLADAQKKTIREILVRLNLPQDRFVESEWRLNLGAMAETDVRIDLANVTELSGLTLLRDLVLNGCKGVDLDVISNLKNLEGLALANTDTVDLKPLASLTKLTHLVLAVNPVVDLAPIQNLPLRILSLDGCKRIKNFETLSRLNNLNKLILQGTSIDDLGVIRNLKRLAILYIGDTPVTDLTPLQGFPLENLRTRNLDGFKDQLFKIFESHREPQNFVVSVGVPKSQVYPTVRYSDYLEWIKVQVASGVELPIEDQKRIIRTLLKRLNLPEDDFDEQNSYLRLDKTDLTRAPELCRLTMLRRLEVRECSNVDFSGLSNLVNLETLAVGMTGISDLRPLARLAKLSTLEIQSSPATDFTPLEKLPLRVLNIYGCPAVTNFDFLSQLTQLRELTVAKTQFSDLNVLKNLENLTVLHIGYTNVRDLTPLHGRRLAYLWAEGIGATEDDIFQLFAAHPEPSIFKVDLVDLGPTLTNAWYEKRLALRGETAQATASQPDLPADRQIKIILFALKALNLPEGRFDEENWRLNLSGADLSRLPDFGGVTLLRSLNLSSCSGIRLDAFSGFVNLTSLEIEYTKVSDLTPLAGFKKLAALELTNAPIIDCTPLKNLPLRSLKLSGCKEIKNFEFLRGLKDLRELFLGDTQITDLNVLQSAIKLTNLMLHHTKVKDLTPLLNKPLTYLGLNRTNATKEDVFQLFAAHPAPITLHVDLAGGVNHADYEEWLKKRGGVAQPATSTPSPTQPELSFDEQVKRAEQFFKDNNEKVYLTHAGDPVRPANLVINRANLSIQIYGGFPVSNTNSLQGLTRLTRLEVGKITVGTDPLRSLTGLEVLRAEITYLSDPNYLGPMKNLKELFLTVAWSRLYPIEQLENLEIVAIRFTGGNVGHSSPSAFVNKPKLRKLSLLNCPLEVDTVNTLLMRSSPQLRLHCNGPDGRELELRHGEQVDKDLKVISRTVATGTEPTQEPAGIWSRVMDWIRSWFPKRKPSAAVGAEELSFEEQVERAKKFLRDNNVFFETIVVDGPSAVDVVTPTLIVEYGKQSIQIKGRFHVTDTTSLEGLTRLTVLELEVGKIANLQPIRSLVNLESAVINFTVPWSINNPDVFYGKLKLASLELKNCSVDVDVVNRLLEQAIPGFTLTLTTPDGGSKIFPKEHRADEKKPAPQEFSFEEQVTQARRFLVQNGARLIQCDLADTAPTVSPETNLFINSKEQTIKIRHIKPGSPDISELRHLEGLTRLTGLQLNKIVDQNLKPLASLSGLTQLSIEITSEEKPVFLSNLKNLEDLTLKVPHPTRTTIDHLEKLESVKLEFTQESLTVFPLALFHKPLLTSLTLTNCRLFTSSDINNFLKQCSPKMDLVIVTPVPERRILTFRHGDVVTDEMLKFGGYWVERVKRILRISPKNPQAPPAGEQVPTFAQEMVAVERFFEANGVERFVRRGQAEYGRIVPNPNDETISVDLSETNLTQGLDKLSPNSRLVTLNISETNVEIIMPLIRHPNLRWINVSGTKIKWNQIRNLLVLHPNPDLQIVAADGTYTRLSLPPLEPAAEPSTAAPPQVETRPISPKEIETGEFLGDLTRSLLDQEQAHIDVMRRHIEEGISKQEIGYLRDLMRSALPKNLSSLGLLTTVLIMAVAAYSVAETTAAVFPQVQLANWLVLLAVAPIFVASMLLLIWLARSLGKRAGPGDRSIAPIPFLARASVDPSTFFFSVDPLTNDYLVNPFVYVVLSKLPRWCQSFLLYGFGVVGHETLHTKGRGEVVAYTIAQALPAIVGSLSVGVIALFFGLSVWMVILLGMLGAFVATAVVSGVIASAAKQSVFAPGNNRLLRSQKALPRNDRQAEALKFLFPDADPVMISMRVDPKSLARQQVAHNQLSNGVLLRRVATLAQYQHSHPTRMPKLALQFMFDQLAGEPERRIQRLIPLMELIYNSARRRAAKIETSSIVLNRSLKSGVPVVIDLSALVRGQSGSKDFESVKEHLENLRYACSANPESRSELILLAHGFDGAPAATRALINAELKEMARASKIAPRLVTDDPRIFRGEKIMIGGIRERYFDNDRTRIFSLYAASEDVFADLESEQANVLLLLMMAGGLVRMSTALENELREKVYLKVQA